MANLTSETILTTDLHLHLYGMLEANDLWEIGKDTYRSTRDRLLWYSLEYEKAWALKPDPIAYWENENGRELLIQDFERCSKKGTASFQQFQSCFNLIIALCPISSTDMKIPRFLLERAHKKGAKQLEVRTVFPFHFTAPQAHRYLTNLCQEVSMLNHELPMETHLVFSLSRQLPTAEKHYRWIKDFQRASPNISRVITGVDFCGLEEEASPLDHKIFFQRFLKEQPKTKLQLLYHVGEQFENLSLETSLGRILQARWSGIRRLGHATSLGISPQALARKIIWEPKQSFEAHRKWLYENSSFLCRIGLDSYLREFHHPFHQDKQAYKIHYTEEYINHIEHLQNITGDYIKAQGTVIECCPFSNWFLSPIKSWDHHPLVAFKKKELQVVFGTDDPGLFSSDWKKEGQLIEKLTESPLQQSTALCDQLFHGNG